MGTRSVHPILQATLKYDVYLTDLLCKICDKFVALRSLRTHHQVLEVSGNGLLWLAGWLASIWVIWNPDLFEMQINFLIGLLIDFFLVMIIKASVRRNRPAGNKNDDLLGTYGPDKYSFPSGHVSRVLYIALFFYFLYPISFIFYPSLLAWTVSVSLTRVLLRRHHLIDVIAGVLLGMVECFLISLIWINKDSAVWIVSWISDEELKGT